MDGREITPVLANNIAKLLRVKIGKIFTQSDYDDVLGQLEYIVDNDTDSFEMLYKLDNEIKDVFK